VLLFGTVVNIHMHYWTAYRIACQGKRREKGRDQHLEKGLYKLV
jgi:hypothetical protein